MIQKRRKIKKLLKLHRAVRNIKKFVLYGITIAQYGGHCR